MEATGPAVLLVEDNEIERDLLGALLRQEGYRVFEAGDGEAALALLPALPRPLAALVNLIMPVMDGWAFLRESQARGLLGGVTVITVSALRSSEHPAGVAATLEKPLDIGALLELLQGCFG